MMVTQQNVMMSPGSPNTSLPITSSAGILNLDHYKYLRSLLPPVPHFIESLSFTDLNNWECQIYVNLVTESDCMKWLADFEEKTCTDWRVDQEGSRGLAKVKGCQWQMVYRCVSTDSKKDCTAQLEMRIFAQDEGRGRHGKQYPCEININFYHSHNLHTSLDTSLLTVTESFKSQDIPSHLKEGFEGYFQETMSPVQPGLTTATVSLSGLKTSPSSPQQVQLQLKPSSHLDGGKLVSMGGRQEEVFDLTEVSAKLDRTLAVLRTMLKQTGASCAAVKHFVDKFDRLRGDQGQLEDALCSFGGQWDWLVSADTSTVNTGAGTVVTSVSSAETSPTHQMQVILQPQSPQDSPGRKKLKKKRSQDEEVITTETMPQQVFSTNIVGGQVVLHPTSTPSEAPDMKRRKRARCGTCSGCLNRDKTQDCRQCRNCLDQKRYGGPGRLKKACIKRQCAVISQMIANEISPEQKATVLHSVQVSPPMTVKTEPQVYTVKSEPQETAVTLATRADTGQTVTIGGQTVSLVGGGQNFSTASQTVSLASGGQTFSIGGQTYSLVGSQGTGQTVVSLAPVSMGGSAVTTTTPSGGQTNTTNSTGPLSASTLLSWPGAQYASTFQVQPQQPVQFVFQPAQGFSSSSAQPVQVQYTAQIGNQQLESLVSEASRHHGVG